MTPARFTQIGFLLYGPQWHAPMAAGLRILRRNVDRFADGEKIIPPGVADDLALLCEAKAAKLKLEAERLRATR